MGLILLIIMMLTPVISVMSVMLQYATKKQNGRWQLISVIMILLAIAIHIVAVRALIATYLNLTSSSVIVVIVISTIVTLLLGGALGLLIQETRQTPS